MEFLRFGSSTPGEYWGCCACCIIQNFKQHPDTPASIQLTSGDGNGACTFEGELAFAGPTLRDVFETRIRIGTFGLDEMPNHAFFAILENSQISEGSVGYEWLKILKANGFEFLRTIDNSVYTGASLDSGHGSSHPNYVFALFRNIGNGRIKDPFTPPKAWTELPRAVDEVCELLSDKDKKALAVDQTESQLKIWKDGKLSIKKESEIVAAGAPVIMAALRTEFPTQLKGDRVAKLKERVDKGCPNKPSSGINSSFYPSIKPVTKKSVETASVDFGTVEVVPQTGS
jgi:hypothetical protein